MTTKTQTALAYLTEQFTNRVSIRATFVGPRPRRMSADARRSGQKYRTEQCKKLREALRMEAVALRALRTVAGRACER